MMGSSEYCTMDQQPTNLPGPIPVKPLSPTPAETETADRARKTLTIYMWPKTPMLWPVAFVALVCAIVGYTVGASAHTDELRQVTGITDTLDREPAGPPAGVTKEQIQAESAKVYAGLRIDRVFGFIFLVTFGFCMFALCIDTEIRWALMAFLGIGLLVTILILIDERVKFLPGFFHSLLTLTPSASPQFYMGIAFVWALLMLISLVTIRFHYVKIESNEVFVVGGLLEGQKRFPTIQMKYQKDVSDVIEYYMPFIHSGRLILSFPAMEDRIILDNVLNIDKVIEQLNVLSSDLRVDSDQRV
jgi:hypothetical protein